jgi:hypothetical protein
MKKIILTFSLAVCFIAFANAQDYKTALGLRAGWNQGLTIKHFISGKSALEGLLAWHYSGFEITGLYEVHNRAFDVERLNWYYGGGAHIGFYGNSYDGGSGTFIGLDGILGLEYNFNDLPINISLDWKPAFDFGYSHFFGDGGALSIRYCF